MSDKETGIPAPALPKDGAQDIPDNFTRHYPSQLEAKKIKKPLICYLIDVDEKNRTRPTLVAKPIKVKYGDKWFNMYGRNGMRYFINYSMVMNFGKHYAYLCQFGNPVGALSFYEYPEDLTDANQVEMMVNQHSVEVFKKHKGISPKLVLIIAIIAAIGVIGAMISAQVALSENTQIGNLKTDNAVKDKTISDLQCKYENICPPPPDTKTTSGVGTVVHK